jgi:hypothetical protein
LALGLIAALSVAGCSETRVQNLLGSNKASTDEEQIPEGRTLAMPPDLNLRPPAAAGSDDTQVAENTAPARTAAVSEPADLDAVPPADQEETAMAAPAESQPAQTVQPVQPVAQQPRQDIYERYGISKVDAEGKAKSERVLYRELHDAQLAEKRKTNPNYGTIWNLGNVFSDD